MRVVKLTFVTDVDRIKESSDAKSNEFLASTNSCQAGEGGASDKTRIGQVLKDIATQSPRLLKGMTEKVKGVGGGLTSGGNTMDPGTSKSEVGGCGMNIVAIIHYW